MGASESLEHAHHIAHSGHAEGHGSGGHDDHRLSRWVGITMAILGVVLAFSAARVGAARTELVQGLVDQQHAHAKYTAQDIKHRVAVLTLQQLHAEADPTRTNGKDMMLIVQNIERYEVEAEAADKWVDAYDGGIEAHGKAQEDYELAQLAAEIGLVIASIALLLRRRAPWILSIVLGVGALGILVFTYLHTSGAVHASEKLVEETEKSYEELRTKNKTTDVDKAFIEEVKRDYGPKK